MKISSHKLTWLCRSNFFMRTLFFFPLICVCLCMFLYTVVLFHFVLCQEVVYQILNAKNCMMFCYDSRVLCVGMVGPPAHVTLPQVMCWRAVLAADNFLKAFLFIYVSWRVNIESKRHKQDISHSIKKIKS